MANNLQLKVVLSALDKITAPLKKIRGGSDSTSKSLREMNQKLKDLSQQQKTLGEFRELHRGLQSTQQKLKEAQSRVASLASQMKQAENPSRTLARQFETAKRSAASLSNSVSQQTVKLQGLRDRLNTAGISTKNLGSHERRLRSEINSTTAAISQQSQRLAQAAQRDARLQHARSRYDRGMQSTAMLAGSGMAARATGLKTATGLGRILHVGYEFDAMMSGTQAVTRIKDKNDPRMLALRDQARTLPLQSKFTDSEVAEGQFFLGRTGYSAEQILKAMPGMLNLAAAGNIDLGTTADIASNIQTAMGIPAEKMDMVADVLTAAFTRNNVDIPMLGESLKYSAGVGKAYGQGIETVTTATALLGNAGIQGSQAGTTMRAVLSRIGTSPAMKKLGVNTKDKQGNMRDLGDILKDISSKTAKMGSVQRGEIFTKIAGRTAVSGFMALMESIQNGKFETMRDSLRNSKGEAAQVAGTQLDNLKGDMTMLHAGFENISVELFEKNSPWLRDLAKDFQHFLHSTADFLKANPALSKALVILLAVFAALATVAGTVMIAVAGMLGPMIATRFMLAQVGIKLPGVIGPLSNLGKNVLPMLGKGFTFLGRAIMANPILAIIAGIAIAALLIYKYWGPISSFAKGLWNEIKAAFSGGILGIVTLLTNWSPIGLFYKAFAAVLKWFGIDLPARFTDFGAMIINGLIDGIKNRFDIAVQKIKDFGALVAETFQASMGIHSPSRLFAEYGGYLTEGLAIGISNGQSQPLKQIKTLTDKIGRISSGIIFDRSSIEGIHIDKRPPISSTFSPTAYGSGETKIEITINPAAGSDPNAIARAVAMELDRREREKATRKSGSYIDY